MKISIVGTVGVPANYGGFETLVENLVKYHHSGSLPDALTVYCSSRHYPEKNPTFLTARLEYIPLSANGIQSVVYDFLSLLSATVKRSDIVLVLGVSGAIAIPLIRTVSSAKIIMNIDGIEWRRSKWKGIAKHFLRLSEWCAVKFSHAVISDNMAISDYVRTTYGKTSHFIPYGGDHVLKDVDPAPLLDSPLPEKYACSVCRIEPENNLHLILDTFSRTDFPLIIVGNWENSEYGRNLYTKYESVPNINLLDSIYSLGKLKTLRQNALCYVHGHSAGGTNPSLVEAMHFGRPVIAYDCSFNRHTTENKAYYFKNHEELIASLEKIEKSEGRECGKSMKEIADKHYRWEEVAGQYFRLFSQIIGR